MTTYQVVVPATDKETAEKIQLEIEEYGGYACHVEAKE